MGALLVYVLKSSICLAVFYLFYRLLLSKETFHRFNRCALLGILFLSLLLPGIEWKTTVSLDVSRAMVQVEEFLLAGQYVETSEESSRLTWQVVLVFLYALGIVAFWMRQFISLGSMYHLISCSSQKEYAGNIRLAIHDKLIGPFSWMHYIVISKVDLRENGEAILLHEQAHIRNGHSWDMLWMDFCISLQWFNPVVWLMKRELQDIHEFEADESVINQGVDAKRYQLLLIKKAVGTRLYSMANSLNHSSLKKRITMMVKKKSNPWARMKYLYVLPLAAIAVAAFARPEVSSELNEISRVKVSDFVADLKVGSTENVSDSKEKFKLQGRVVDEGGTPIPNATVIIKNTSSGTVTKGDGRFSLMLSPGQEICVSYIGMKMKVVGIPKSESKEKLIVLKPEEISIGELQVPGEEIGDKVSMQQKTMQEPVKQKINEQGDVFTVVEQMPDFPGGMKELMNFLGKNIRYPDEAYKNKVEGRVIVQFLVKKDGSTSDFKVVRSVHPLLDAEAVRVLKTMPKWIPGTQRGQAVNVKFVIPVSFKLQGDQKNVGEKGLEAIRQNLHEYDSDISDINVESVVRNVQQFMAFANKKTEGTEKATPLIVVDGKEVTGGLQALKGLKAENIEEIRINTDVPQIAKYGEKAKNGVVLVTTKK